MRKSEKDFLKLVTKEGIPLLTISKKLNISQEDAYAFMVYLEKQNLLRYSSTGHDAFGYPIYAVLKPMDNRKLKEKYWWLIAILAYIFGIISGIISDIAKPKIERLINQEQTLESKK